MSTKTTTPSTIGPAPWRALFLDHLAQLDSPEFTLASLAPAREDEHEATPYVPRVRTCIYRGMFAELPANKHNAAPRNARVYESDLPTFTTDVRMAKTHEIFASSRGHGAADQSRGSGGGGPVEAVFWVRGAMTQWRVRGHAYAIGPDIEGAAPRSSGVLTVRAEVGKRMRVVAGREAEKAAWSWATELTAHFGNLSPGMRGSFKNPAPGTVVSLPVADPNLGLGQKVGDDGLHDETARANFRLVVITPDVVEQLDLSDPETARRWRFTYVGPEEGGKEGGSEDVIGEWKKEELWP